MEDAEPGDVMMPADYAERCQLLQLALAAFRPDESKVLEVRVRRRFDSLFWRRTRVYPAAYRGEFAVFANEDDVEWTGGVAPFIYVTNDHQLVVRERKRYAFTNVNELAMHLEAYEFDLVLISLDGGEQEAFRYAEGEMRKGVREILG